MKCKLCPENTDLVKKSHILPDFVYRNVFDDKHRMFEIRLNDGTVKTKIGQSGSYESNILCKRCENDRLGKLERLIEVNYFFP